MPEHCTKSAVQQNKFCPFNKEVIFDCVPGL